MMNGGIAMPPLGADEQRISNAISQIMAAASQDIQQLSVLDVSTPHSAVQALEAKVQDQFRRLRSILQDLQYAAEEQETPDQVQRVATCLAHHQGELDRAHKAYLDARVSFARRKDQSYVQQRQELIGSPDFSQRQRRIASEQDALTGAQDVTASLRRTKQLMAQNLEQTHGNISVIAAGNRRLGEADDELVGQKQHFREAHGSLGTLKRQAMIDRLAFWGGFAFFMLVVAYISFKRTPAFMKQPLYALLHMKQGGQPFTATDYAAANIPPGTFLPTEKPWGAGEAAYPNEWAAWDSNFAGVQGPADGQGAFAEAEWLDAEKNEQVQRVGGEAWQRGEDGSLLPPRLQRLRQQEQQQQRVPDAPHTPRQGQEQPPGSGQQCMEGDVACHAAAAAATAAAGGGSESWGCSATDGSCHGAADGAHRQQDADEDDEPPGTFHDEPATPDYPTWPTEHPADSQQQQQQHAHPPAALGIIDPDAAHAAADDNASSSPEGQPDPAAAAAVPGSSPEGQASVEEDADELEYIRQQQAQQQAAEAERLALQQQQAMQQERERAQQQALQQQQDYANWVYGSAGGAHGGAGDSSPGLLDDLDYYGERADPAVLDQARGGAAAGGAGGATGKQQQQQRAGKLAGAAGKEYDSHDSSMDGVPGEAVQDLDDISKLIEEEQARAFTIMDMEDVGLYHYEPEGSEEAAAAGSSSEWEQQQQQQEEASGSDSEHTEL
ncbi:hypothetical protein OEZ85_006647 [Tetradesmus obliquus]|uniref:Sec20 C-terminal domain-containing protein n=1 Tax=Tetradesmus obliquus TaxID=3088 RepID=A0ABY8TVZ6_TETOB|nr:hypothetical protein OEZ85_006647 [Tetradesmus obliquus]